MCPLLSFSPHIFYVTYVIRKNKKNILNLSKANKHIIETSPFYMPEPKLYVALVYVRTWAAEERREQERGRSVDHPLPSRPPPRLAQLRDAERGSRGPLGRASSTDMGAGSPWQAGPYLRVGRHHKLGGQADVGHPAFRGEGHRVGQGVLHLDGGRCALPDRAHHLDGFDDA